MNKDQRWRKGAAWRAPALLQAPGCRSNGRFCRPWLGHTSVGCTVTIPHLDPATPSFRRSQLQYKLENLGQQRLQPSTIEEDRIGQERRGDFPKTVQNHRGIEERTKGHKWHPCVTSCNMLLLHILLTGASHNREVIRGLRQGVEIDEQHSIASACPCRARGWRSGGVHRCFQHWCNKREGLLSYAF